MGLHPERDWVLMLSLEQVDPRLAPPLDRFADHTIFQTDEWLDFVEETQGAKRVVAVVRDGSAVVGRFTGLTMRKMGLRVLGSPFPGWSSAYMGFNLEPGVPRAEALAALETFAFRDLRCVHYEVMDRHLSVDCPVVKGGQKRLFRTYEIDLTPPEDEVFAGMDRSRRKSIRQSERRGVQIVEADDAAFADEMYSQVCEVFARQGLRPTYDLARVHSLIRHLTPTGSLLLLRALETDGECTSTGLFLGYGGRVYAWGGAGRRNASIRHSFELVLWHAMKHWKDRGMSVFDMGGGGDYKQKYGAGEVCVPWIRHSRYAGLERGRELARRAYRLRQRMGTRALLGLLVTCLACLIDGVAWVVPPTMLG
jgi:CelD/BcsL family acetyltransferase involved in cellulose biosynthesis